MNDEDRLRRALNAHAETVDVESYALTQIRQRIAARRRAWWRLGPHIPRGGIMAFAGVAATVTVAVLAFGSCAPPPSTPNPAPGDSGSASPSGPPDASQSPAQPGAVTELAVYYLGEVKPLNRYRLFREFHRTSLPDNSIATRIKAAVTDMLGSNQADPEYTNFWPDSTRVLDVRVEGPIATVNLTGASKADGPPEYVPLAVQELVWTVTAADSSVTGVRLEFDGQAVQRLWGAMDTSSVIRRGPAIDLLAPVWLISPQNGAQVGPTFEVHVAGATYEATATLRVRDSTGKVVREQVLTMNIAAPSRGEIKVQVKDLPKGQYTLQAFYFSARDGAIEAMDDKVITVR
jgi:hypothetical protein